jgi:putative ABC transport system permease protein
MNQLPNIDPPRWPVKLLRFFLKKEYLEEIEGDMEEVFRENAEQYSIRKARRIYAFEIFSLLRPVLLKNLSSISHFNQHAMFKNYFKISFRNLLKNPVNSFINIFGLAAAIGFCVFSYAFSQWTFNTDQFHEHKNETFLITYTANKNGTIQEYGKTPAPLGELLRQDFAQSGKVCMVKDRAVVMKHQDHVYHERVRLTDPEFLEMLTFPLKWGTPESLTDINSIILSEAMSEKYFGDENPIGRSITMIYDQNKSKEFKITGVAKEFPRSRTISFSFLINFQNAKIFDPGFNPHDWKTLVDATFIFLNDPAAVQSVKASMDKYRQLQNQTVEEQWAISSFGFEALATLHKASERIIDDISRSSRTNYVSIIFMVGISILLLILACVNYINIAIATAAKRLKELGVRKSIGASRGALIVQFLSENVVITFFALLVGLILGYTFFIPGFEFLWSFDMDFSLTDFSLWFFLLGILLITSILSGLYPSLYISRFQVVGILKGSVKFGQKNPLTKGFLSLQLILSCVFITCSVLFTQNSIYLSKRPWGYNNRQALYTKVPDVSAYEKLSALMLQHPDVLSISGSQHHVGKSHVTTVVEFPDRKLEVDQLAVDANYFETLELNVKEGRTFVESEQGDKNALIVNEAMVSNMGWTNAIGEQLRIDTVEYEVVGVVSDFHNYSFDEKIKPTIFSNAAKENYRFLSLKVKKGTTLKAQQMMQANWAKLFPETPYEGAYQEDVWGAYYEQLDIYSIVWKVIAGIAVSLATLGLYGLVRLNIEGRTKEFSIRKVLGAGLKNIARTITSQYTILFATTIIIGAPLGYTLGKWIIEMSFPYHAPIDLSAVAIAVVIILTVLMGTISTQILKVQKANPVDGLKVE